MTPSPNSGVRPPVLGILVIGKKNHYLVEARAFAQYYRAHFEAEPGIVLTMPGDLLFDQEEIVAAARRMEHEGADLILLAIGSWVYPAIPVAALNDLHTPFVLYGLSDQVANGSIGSALQVAYVLREMGKSFHFLSGPIADPANLETVHRLLRAAWVRRSLRNRRIATIGGKCMMMYQAQVNEFDWKAVFGVDFPQYDTAQVFNEMRKVDDAEAERVEQEFLAGINAVHWELDTGERIYEDAIRVQARLYLAFRRMQELYGIDVFANKCMPEMSHEEYGFGYAGCLATCMLNNAGVMTACEADVPAALPACVQATHAQSVEARMPVRRLERSGLVSRR